MSTKEMKLKLKERRKTIDRSKIPKRPAFTDEAIRDAKNAPAPGQYMPKVALFEKVKGSVQMKIDKKSYIDEEVKKRAGDLGPGALNPKVN